MAGALMTPGRAAHRHEPIAGMILTAPAIPQSVPKISSKALDSVALAFPDAKCLCR